MRAATKPATFRCLNQGRRRGRELYRDEVEATVASFLRSFRTARKKLDRLEAEHTIVALTCMLNRDYREAEAQIHRAMLRPNERDPKHAVTEDAGNHSTSFDQVTRR